MGADLMGADLRITHMSSTQAAHTVTGFIENTPNTKVDRSLVGGVQVLLVIQSRDSGCAIKNQEQEQACCAAS